MSRTAIGVLALLAAGLAAAVGASDSRKPEPKLPLEVPDQPPAAVSARDDATARSPGMRVASGPYVSVQVNVDSLGRNIIGDAANEPSIAVSPVNPQNMVVGWRQFNSIASNFRQAGWAYTFNRGASWTFPGVLTPGTFRSDPVIDVDASGIFYYQSLKGNFTLDVFKSVNGGVTWGPPVPSFGGDKNWFVIDRTGGPGAGFQYGIWQRFASCCGADVLTRSIDAGQTYAAPVSVPASPTFGMLAIGPDGTLFAAGIDGTTTQDFSQFVLSRATNAPNPGQAPVMATVPVDLGGSMAISTGPNPAGLLGQALVAADHSGGDSRGNVYVMASVVGNGSEPSTVTFARSENDGQSFSPPVRVNDDSPDNLNWHWMAASAVAPNGRIDAIWYDTRETGSENLSRLYYAYSWDAGATWSPNVAVSPQFDSWVGWPQQNKMGDYSGIVSDVSGADVAYAATFNNEQDVYYVRLFPDCNGNGVSDVTDIAGASPDCNLSHLPDECEAAPACIGAGTVPDDGLRIDKGPGSELALHWSASCVAGDSDYAVYEGALGGFASRTPRTCSTGGATTASLAPPAADAYYLVVPVHADREGSYGADSAGAERPPSAGACAPQAVHACGT